MAFITGCISAGAVAMAASIRLIFSSGLFPSMLPSRLIFFAIALITSGYALSLSADSMIGLRCSMAVLGSPLPTASLTFFHCSSRGGCAAEWALRTSATPTATQRSESPTVARRCDRFIGNPFYERGSVREKRGSACVSTRRATVYRGLEELAPPPCLPDARQGVWKLGNVLG